MIHPLAHVTKKGYLRIHAKGQDRNKYVHRHAFEEQIKEQRRNAFASLIQTDPEYTETFLSMLERLEADPDKQRLSLDKEVHHTDGRRDHNCAGNLILLDAAIHEAISAGKVPHRKKAMAGYVRGRR